MSKAAHKRMGRPPEGSGKKGEPERIRDYPVLLITIRPTMKRKLKAISSAEDRPVWQIVEDAVELYFGQLAVGLRRAIQSQLRPRPGEDCR
jgi:hypothetical protein